MPVVVASNITFRDRSGIVLAVQKIVFHLISVFVAAGIFLLLLLSKSQAEEHGLQEARLLELPSNRDIRTLKWELNEPSRLRIRAMGGTEYCDSVKAVLLSENRAIVEVWGSTETTFPSKDDDYYGNVPLLDLVLPTGLYNVNLSNYVRDDGEDADACKALILTELTPVKANGDQKYHGYDTRYDNELLAITTRLMQSDLLPTVELDSVSVQSREPWTSSSLVKFLTYYCRSQAPRNTTNLHALTDLDKFAWNRRRDVTETENENNTKNEYLRPFFEVTIQKYIQTRFSGEEVSTGEKATGDSEKDNFSDWLRPADIVCRTELPGLEEYAMNFAETLALLKSSKSARYLVEYAIANVGRDDAEKWARGDNDLSTEYVQTAYLMADALGVKASELSLRIYQGNCSYSLNFISFTRPLFTDGMCDQSSSTWVQLANYMGGVKIEKPRPVSGAVTPLVDAVASVLPPNALIEWQDQDELGVRVKVRNVRGWVSSSSNYWERAFITAALLGTRENQRLLVVVDGSVCSGAGARPPAEANCLKSMDTVPNYNLAEFAKTISNRIAAALIAQ
ncbi:hypothetical protein ACC718_14965 [Rhizobium ruizarguesonis]